MLINPVLISDSMRTWSDSWVQYYFITLRFSVYLEEIIKCSSEENRLFVQIITLVHFCTVYGKSFSLAAYGWYPHVLVHFKLHVTKNVM